jgi:hypothetical protein
MTFRKLTARRAAGYRGPLLRPWLAAGWCMVAVLVALCLTPLETLPLDSLSHIDKVYHCLAFAELMWWFAVVSPVAAWWRLVGWLAGLAVGIEIAQSFIPLRAASVGDVVADLFGLVLGAAVALATPAGFPSMRSAKCAQNPPETPPPASVPDTTRDPTRRRS